MCALIRRHLQIQQQIFDRETSSAASIRESVSPFHRINSSPRYLLHLARARHTSLTKTACCALARHAERDQCAHESHRCRCQLCSSICVLLDRTHHHRRAELDGRPCALLPSHCSHRRTVITGFSRPFTARQQSTHLRPPVGHAAVPAAHSSAPPSSSSTSGGPCITFPTQPRSFSLQVKAAKL